MSTGTKVFNLLSGMWTISRKIPGYGEMKGIANFDSTVNSNELKYKEKGLFIFDNGNQCEAHREYLYRLNKKNNEIEVYFIENDDNFNRLFHTLEFINNNIEDSNKVSSLLITPQQEQQQFLSAKALHNCCEDTYKIKYEIFKDNQFNIIYIVNGPTKNYVSETCFTKIEH